MDALLLILVTVGLSIQGVSQKAYNQRTRGGAYLFSAAGALAAGIIFLITSGGNLQFRWDVSLYSLLFAAGYSLALVCSVLAIKTGSLSISSLILQFSLIIPTFYGLIALKEPIKLTLFVGIALLLLSLVLVNLDPKEKGTRPTLKWAIFAALSFVGNGLCSTVQKVQQVNFPGEYKSEFMLVALAVTVLVLSGMSFWKERAEIPSLLKKGFPFYILYGLANGLCNLMVMLLAVRMPSSVMYPIISAGGTLATSLIAIFFYKEKMSRLQLIGLALGILAIVALNL